MADIIAFKIVNGKAVKQRFNENAWKLLGIDKNGWQEATPQTVENSIKAQKTASGPQIIENSVTKVKEPEAPKTNSIVPDESKIVEFMNAIEGFNKSTIKDFFDNSGVKYDNRASLSALKEELGHHFKFDIVELQKAFA